MYFSSLLLFDCMLPLFSHITDCRCCHISTSFSFSLTVFPIWPQLAIPNPQLWCTFSRRLKYRLIHGRMILREGNPDDFVATSLKIVSTRGVRRQCVPRTLQITRSTFERTQCEFTDIRHARIHLRISIFEFHLRNN